MMIKKLLPEELNSLKTWANANASHILSYLGIEYDDRGKYLTGKCPIPYHPGDRSNIRAFAWSFDKNNWHCYSHSCHEDTSTDIFGLVMSMKEMAFGQALALLYHLRDGPFKDIQPVKRAYTTVSNEVDNTKIDPDKLSILLPDTYFLGRGISKEVLEKHKVGYWQKTGSFMDRRAIVPVFDAQGYLVGFSGRIISEDDAFQAKWVHGKDFVTRKAGVFNKSSILYNLNECLDVVRCTKKVFIVEGPIDVFKMEMAGVSNVVATLGLGLSFAQQQLLVNLGVELVVLCYDNDEHDAGLLAAQRIQKQISNIFRVEIKLPPSKKDYGEMSVSEILETLFK